MADVHLRIIICWTDYRHFVESEKHKEHYTSNGVALK